MFDVIAEFAGYLVRRCLYLPLELWVELQWKQLRFRETRHLLRLDDYLLRDMGLRRVGKRIEAIDPARFDSTRAAHFGSRRRRRRNRGLRSAN